MRDRYGPWALVTGAAMGLGAEFARQLAAGGLNLVLVDVRPDELAAHARAVAGEFGVEVLPVCVDLTAPDSPGALIEATRALEVGLLVNNAGISSVGEFLDVPLERHLDIVALNVRVPTALAHHFGGLMRERRRGGLVFVSSMSALAGTVCVGSYAATKAYGLTLGEALWEELRSCNVDVLSVIVGTTDTPGWRAENPDPESATWPPVMTPADTVREALRALGTAPSVVPGRANRLATFLVRLLPRRTAIRIFAAAMRRRYGNPGRGSS